jgi:hypothetical protein
MPNPFPTSATALAAAASRVGREAGEDDLAREGNEDGDIAEVVVLRIARALLSGDPAAAGRVLGLAEALEEMADLIEEESYDEEDFVEAADDTHRALRKLTGE